MTKNHTKTKRFPALVVLPLPVAMGFPGCQADEVSFSSAMGGSWSRAMQLMSEALDQQRCNMVVAHAAIGDMANQGWV